MKTPFDIAPFALPNCPPGEIRFEEPRDIVTVVVSFRGHAPRRVGLSYLRSNWPRHRVETVPDVTNPCVTGWSHMDDWFNGTWAPAAVIVQRLSAQRISVSFRGLRSELPDVAEYNVTFRRTLGLRLDVADPESIRHIAVYTSSLPTRTSLRIELNAGHRTPGQSVACSGYNANVTGLRSGRGTSLHPQGILRRGKGPQVFELDVAHMTPAHRYCGDNGHILFDLGRDSFTISLPALHAEGPIWYEDKGVFITQTDRPLAFAQYRADCKGRTTVAQDVRALPEQSYGAAYLGQPRPHAVAYSLGFKHSRQRFWLEPNGDLCLARHGIAAIPGPDTPRYANKGEGRFFFGLERWTGVGRSPDPAPSLAYTLRVRKDNVELEQRSVACPMDGSTRPEDVKGDRTMVCLLAFRFVNRGDTPAEARLDVGYSQESGRTPNVYPMSRRRKDGANDWLVPPSPREALAVRDGAIWGQYNGQSVLRCAASTTMTLAENDGAVRLSQRLEPGAACEVLLRVPFVALDTDAETQALNRLHFEPMRSAMAAFWRRENAAGAQLHTPVPQLNDLHRAHLSYIQMSDSAMPAEPHLVNTSVGTSTYGNFSNEACMINQELDQRSLVDDARRRLLLWVRYQGTATQPGNFTDYQGMYYGAGGFECGAYNQHHGWVLWRLAQHFLYTGDRAWFGSVAESLRAGCDWVFRQRRNTLQPLPHSRGWERGFLPAGSLEDVQDFYYWLSTNALTWRAVDLAARALQEFGDPDAARVRREADAYARDLRRGFETMRQHSPLVRLRDGRWVPHYPSRLYCRGRDFGWIREVLEGSVYLLISGLYDARGQSAQWILDDYHDNRYVRPPYGYPIANWEHEWYDRGGFSIQPNLLAGLMPHLDRDEPEIYIWMFFNAWCSCYREEISAMIEHPWPFLGYSNTAHPKTSDEANAVMWLRYMFVYPGRDLLHFGRAIPRTWFRSDEPIGAQRVSNEFGTFSVTYRPGTRRGSLEADLDLAFLRPPGKALVRFRHPDAKPVRSVTVNGTPHPAFDPEKGDVDVTAFAGHVHVVADYA